MAKAKVKEEVPVYNTYEDFPSEDLYQYAGVDCLATSGLLTAVFPKIVEKKTYRYFGIDGPETKPAPAIIEFMESFVMKAHEYCIDMEINGILFDVDENRRQTPLIEAELSQLQDEIFSGIGRKINLDSGLELSKFLYGEMGFEATSFTKKKEPSTDGDAIEDLYKIHGHDWLAKLGRRNNLASVYRSFFKSYVEDYVKRDSRVHCQVLMHGTSSSRVSVINPNMNAIPNSVTESKLGYSVKRQFVAEKGKVIIAGDFSSCEVKIASALAGPGKMREAVEAKLDFHSFSAAEMHGLDYNDVVMALEYDGPVPELLAKKKLYKAYRQGAKALTFSILFGSSVAGIANSIGITVAEAERLLALYFRAFPELKGYVENCHNEAIVNHYVMNAFGQVKHEYGAMPIFRKTAAYNAALRNSTNVRIQSSASSAGLYAFAMLNEGIKPIGGKSMLSIYDASYFEIPAKNAAQGVERTYYHMDDEPVQVFDWLPLPIGVDVEAGPSLKEMVPVPRGTTQIEFVALMERNFPGRVFWD